MAKVMSYTDPATGAHYPASVWLPMFEAGDFTERSVRIVFNGYADLTALSNGRAPIAQRSYVAERGVFLAFVMSPPVGDTLFDVVSNACYQLAAQTLDAEDGAGNAVSFFASAEDVNVSLV